MSTKRIIVYQYSVTQGEWITERTRTATTTAGFDRIAKQLAAEYRDDFDRDRGGNIYGTTRFRFVVDGQTMSPSEFCIMAS